MMNPTLFQKSVCLFIFVAFNLGGIESISNLGYSAAFCQEESKPNAPSKAKKEAQESKPSKKKFDVDSDPDRPFQRRIDLPDFPKDSTWLNTTGPLRKRDLNGKFVIIDFWTYCCINCIHVLPTLKKIEEKYEKEVVVIGVHSAKFETEKDSKNITDAILRYEIKHPVINDHDHKIWDGFGVRSWPTLLLVDPEGKVVWAKNGETRFEELDLLLKVGIEYYKSKDLLNEEPFHIETAKNANPDSPLRFPGKILADEKNDRLFITDSNHNRIVITKLDGTLVDIIGSGSIGKVDGKFADCSFDHPQGVAQINQTLYISDTENHLLRKADLKAKTVTTIAGVGTQAVTGFPGLEKLLRDDPLPDRWIGKPLETALNSPWALWIHKDQLYIAMAGPHQIWKMPLDESEIGPFAGNGREDIVDGKLLPKEPYAEGFSSFAQPSGLTSDGDWLFVADSEGSSIRAVPFDSSKQVKTVIGTAGRPRGRLFDFGDIDGDKETARLQHALGVVYHEKKIYVADTYNNKIKVVDADSGETKTIAGTGAAGDDNELPTFDEPAGITFAKNKLYVADTNNHLIRTIDLKTQEVTTLTIANLKPPQKAKKKRPDFSNSKTIDVPLAKVTLVKGKFNLRFDLKFDDGWKINDQVAQKVYIESTSTDGAILQDAIANGFELNKENNMTVSLAAKKAGSDSLKVAIVYYYCQNGGEGLCKVGSLVFNLPIEIDAKSSNYNIRLKANGNQ